MEYTRTHNLQIWFLDLWLDKQNAASISAGLVQILQAVSLLPKRSQVRMLTTRTGMCDIWDHTDSTTSWSNCAFCMRALLWDNHFENIQVVTHSLRWSPISNPTYCLWRLLSQCTSAYTLAKNASQNVKLQLQSTRERHHWDTISTSKHRHLDQVLMSFSRATTYHIENVIQSYHLPSHSPLSFIAIWMHSIYNLDSLIERWLHYSINYLSPLLRLSYIIIHSLLHIMHKLMTSFSTNSTVSNIS